MKPLLLVAALALNANLAAARDAQLLDPTVLGEPTSHPVTPLFEKKGDEVAPWYFQLDVACDRYAAATVTYSGRTIHIEEVRASLNALYAQHQVRTPDDRLIENLWRIEHEDSGTVGIQLSEDANDCETVIRVIYILGAEWAHQCRRSMYATTDVDAPTAPTDPAAENCDPRPEEDGGG